MKNLSKLAILSLSTTLLLGIAAAQSIPPYDVLTDLTEDQVKALKQLGPASDDSPNELYDSQVESILTPEQHAEYLQKLSDKTLFNELNQAKSENE